MIVLLAILNDGAILSIAYDNVRYSNKPESWDMRFVLVIASTIGLFAALRSFGIFFIGNSVLHLTPALIQTLVYLNLSVGGHLTVFVARTRGPFWSIPPARILLIAVIGTQLVATLIAVYGVFMTPIGWELAGLVWLYTLVMFPFQDQVKLLAYRIFQPGFIGKPGKREHIIRFKGYEVNPSSGFPLTSLPFRIDKRLLYFLALRSEFFMRTLK